MINKQQPISTQSAGVSLVGGNSKIRHERQILLRSEDYDVRSYATSAALLADPRSRDCACIVVDAEIGDGDSAGLSLLRQMRASGWHGNAILLDGFDEEGPLALEAGRNGDRVFSRDIGDRSLIAAIAASAGAI